MKSFEMLGLVMRFTGTFSLSQSECLSLNSLRQSQIYPLSSSNLDREGLLITLWGKKKNANNSISLLSTMFSAISHPSHRLGNIEFVVSIPFITRVPRGSEVRCLTRNPGVLGSSLTRSSGFFRGSVLGQDTSEPSLVLVKPRKA